jgi:hypothetical protein
LSEFALNIVPDEVDGNIKLEGGSNPLGATSDGVEVLGNSCHECGTRKGAVSEKIKTKLILHCLQNFNVTYIWARYAIHK